MALPEIVTVAEEKLVNVLVGSSLAGSTGINFVELNVYLETAALGASLTAAVFAMFFQIRRWYRGRQAKDFLKD